METKNKNLLRKQVIRLDGLSEWTSQALPGAPDRSTLHEDGPGLGYRQYNRGTLR
jgi:hypothetical protein